MARSPRGGVANGGGLSPTVGLQTMTADGSRSGGYSEFVELWTAARALDRWDGSVAILRGVGVPLFDGAAPYAIGGTALCYRWALKVGRRRQHRLRAAPLETIPV